MRQAWVFSLVVACSSQGLVGGSFEADDSDVESSGGGASGSEGDAVATSSGSQSSASGGMTENPPPGSCESDDTVHQGQATWYELATPLVNCSYETSTLPPYYGAMNTADYDDSAICGSCLRVDGPNGSVEIQIVDQCPLDSNPICVDGHIDLNPAAFEQIADLVTGVVPITWHRIECGAQGNVTYRFKEGSSAVWTALMVRNHRHPISKVEWDHNGEWKEMVRQNYNYFVADQGMGMPPYTIRVTDVYGQVIEDGGIPLQIGTPLPSGVQFPTCEP